MTTRLIRSRPLPAFVLLACLVGWLPYLLAAAGVGTGPENLPLGPLVAAAIVTACCGREALATWWRRVRSVRLPLVWLAVALLLPVAMHAVQVMVNHGFGAPLPTSAQLAGWTSVPVGFVTMLILVGVGEEAGWTAFATPLLLRKYSFGTTFAVMAAIRIGWHLPLMLTGNLNWVLGTLGNAGFQLVLLCVYRFSGDRWSAAAVLHASLNALGGPFLFQMVTGADRARLAVIMSVAYALLGLALAAALARRRPSEEQAIIDDVETSRAGPPDVAAAVAAYDLGTLLAPPVPAARGQQGVVWRVETDRGRFAVKELVQPVTEPEVAVDVALQSTMVTRGLHAPRPLTTPAGSVLTSVGPLLFRAYTWVDIDDERLDLDPAALGILLATLHRDPIPAGPPIDPWYTDPVADDDWAQVADRLAAARAPFATEFAASVPHFRAMQDVFRPTGPTQLCHRDLWAGNIRLSPDGLCVIDWDNCGPAEAVQELAMPLFDFCHRSPDRARAFYRAYLDAGGPARLTGRGDFTMVLAQFGHFAITAGKRWLEAADGDRAHAEAWFREGWERPLDVAGIDDLLDAVRHA